MGGLERITYANIEASIEMMEPASAEEYTVCRLSYIRAVDYIRRNPHLLVMEEGAALAILREGATPKSWNPHVSFVTNAPRRAELTGALQEHALTRCRVRQYPEVWTAAASALAEWEAQAEARATHLPRTHEPAPTQPPQPDDLDARIRAALG